MGDIYYDTIYLRDPFDDQSISSRAKKYVGDVLRLFHYSKSIDNIASYERMESFEDKYCQFMKYSDYMPNAFLSSDGTFLNGKHLAKKRISQRAKDIYFNEAFFNEAKKLSCHVLCIAIGELLVTLY